MQKDQIKNVKPLLQQCNISGALPPDVTLKDIKQIKNYFGEHDATLFEQKAFSILSKLIDHIEITGGNDR